MAGMSLSPPRLSYGASSPTSHPHLSSTQLSHSGTAGAIISSAAATLGKSPKRSGLFGLRRSKAKPVCTCHLYAQWIREQQQNNALAIQQQSHPSFQLPHQRPDNCQYRSSVSGAFPTPSAYPPPSQSQFYSQIPHPLPGGNGPEIYSYPTATTNLPYLNVPSSSTGNGSVPENRSPELYLYRHRMASQDSGGYDYGTGGRVRRWSGESSRFSVTESDNAYFGTKAQPNDYCQCSKCQRDRSKRAVSFGPANTLLYDDPTGDPYGAMGSGGQGHKSNAQLTTELLPLDTQIPLQFQLMSDSAMMCRLM